jgi:uncharacterized membrane protein
MAAAVLVAAGLIGCNQSPPGGKTSKDTPSKSTFKIKAPLTSTTIKQGDKQTVKLTLDRGKDFKEDVTLTVDAPEGLTVELDPKKVKASDGETVTMSVSVAKTAAVGDQTIQVTGKPETGDSTSVDVKVKVEKPAE